MSGGAETFKILVWGCGVGNPAGAKVRNDCVEKVENDAWVEEESRDNITRAEGSRHVLGLNEVVTKNSVTFRCSL